MQFIANIAAEVKLNALKKKSVSKLEGTEKVPLEKIETKSRWKNGINALRIA
jgi:hypothetical protein